MPRPTGIVPAARARGASVAEVEPEQLAAEIEGLTGADPFGA
ncbi:MAG: hypothetical protein ACK2US_05750 [Anaerolineae bacterium]